MHGRVWQQGIREQWSDGRRLVIVQRSDSFVGFVNFVLAFSSHGIQACMEEVEVCVLAVSVQELSLK